MGIRSSMVAMIYHTSIPFLDLPRVRSVQSMLPENLQEQLQDSASQAKAAERGRQEKIGEARTVIAPN